jgi:hypothetical protein
LKKVYRTLTKPISPYNKLFMKGATKFNGVRSMSVKDIPPEIRWEIAARLSSNLARGYSSALKHVMGEKIVKMEEAIWAEEGKQVKNIATSLGLPAASAPEVDDAWLTVASIIIPGIKSEIVDSSLNKVVDKITSCSMCSEQKNLGLPIQDVCKICKAFNKNAVESLNPDYTQSFTKRMCRGDDYCESVVELKKFKIRY